MENPFIRLQMALGDEALEKLRSSHVAVFGIGGVGGYAVEALARAGIGQLDLIDQLQKDIKAIGLTVEKTNVNGDKNIDANPLVSQLPKYNDTANKTLGVMLDIIQRLGTAAPAGDKLGEFLSE